MRLRRRFDLADEFSSPPPPHGRRKEGRRSIRCSKANRGVSAEDEYLNLIVEVLYLEERADRPRARRHRRAVPPRADRPSGFHRAARLLRTLDRAREARPSATSEKAAMLDAPSPRSRGRRPWRTSRIAPKTRRRKRRGDSPLSSSPGAAGRPAHRRALRAGQNAGRAGTGAQRPEDNRRGQPGFPDGPGAGSEAGPNPAGHRPRQRSHDKRVVPFLAGFLNAKESSVRVEAGAGPGPGAGRRRGQDPAGLPFRPGGVRADRGARQPRARRRGNDEAASRSRGRRRGAQEEIAGRKTGRHVRPGAQPDC